MILQMVVIWVFLIWDEAPTKQEIASFVENNIERM